MNQERLFALSVQPIEAEIAIGIDYDVIFNKFRQNEVKRRKVCQF